MKRTILTAIIFLSIQSVFAFNNRGYITDVTVDGSNNITVAGTFNGWIGVVNRDTFASTNYCLFTSGNQPCTSSSYSTTIISYASLPAGHYRGYTGYYSDPFIAPPNWFNPSSIDNCINNYPTWCGDYYGSFDFDKLADGSITLTDPSVQTIEKMIENATTSFMATTGFTPAQSISSVGGMFILPFIGGGIMLLMLLIKWIIAIAILSTVVYFSYRAFVIHGEKGRGKIKKK